MKKIVGLWTVITLFSCTNNNAPNNSSANATNDSTVSAASTKEASTSSTEIKYDNYCNERYGFCIEYPSNMLVPQGESESGDGQVFLSADSSSSLTVYYDMRCNLENSTKDALSNAFKEDSKSATNAESVKNVTYKKLGTNFFVVSGYNNGKIFYQKTSIIEKGMATGILEYTEANKNEYNKIAEKIFSSF